MTRDPATRGYAPTSLYAGTYAEGGGLGIYPLLRGPGGTWTAGDPLRGALNASYGAYASRFDLHYLLDEKGGTVTAWRHVEGQWARVATLAAGRDPCFIALDPTQSAIAVANYGNGSLAYFRVDPATGVPAAPPTVRPNAGRSVDPERQGGPHAHCARFSPDGRWLFQTDLGTDEIRAFAHDPEKSQLAKAAVVFAVPPGSGPRHLLFNASGVHAYLISELASNIVLFGLRDGRLERRQTVSALPPGYAGTSLGGHIALGRSGTRLYASNRGHDSIAVFAIDEAGRLALLQHAPTGGRSLRFFLISEDDAALLVAHETDGTLRILDIDADGLLTLDDAGLLLPGAAFLFEA